MMISKIFDGHGSRLIVCFSQSSFKGDLTGRNPTTDRGKRGIKRYELTDQDGIPLSVVITASNTHDMKSAAETLDNMVITKKRRIPSSSSKIIQKNLCLDKGYDFQEIVYMNLSKEDIHTTHTYSR